MGVNNDDELEALKNKFIIGEGEYDTNKLKEHINALLSYTKLIEDGRVIFQRNDLDTKDKIGLVLLSRFIGNKLNEKFESILSVDKISSYTKIEKGSIYARAKELKDEGYISIPERGKYQFNSYMIDQYLESIEE